MAKFYRDAFGWQTRLLGEEMGNYVLVTTTEFRAVEYLAERLFFELERDGDLYSIYRKIGGFTPRHDLTLDEVEKVLVLWKLQGPHGG
jgi:hypothetical protein